MARSLGIANAKAHLSEPVERAAGADTIQTTCRGKPVEQIIAAAAPRKCFDIAAHCAMIEKTPIQPEPARVFVRDMRDDERF